MAARALSERVVWLPIDGGQPFRVCENRALQVAGRVLLSENESTRWWIMPAMSRADVEVRLGKLQGWERDDDEIEKEFRFDGFDASMAFVNRVADLARDGRPPPGYQHQVQPRQAHPLDAQRRRRNGEGLRACRED